ncbi:MAG: HAD family hydrolase [Myxococcales bacterium]|nr:HAD family hydrolase [Myxococcales bacterium]
MPTRLVILDFDGTFTDAHAEAVPFVAGFKRDLADLLGREISAVWERWEAEVTRHPDRYGWMNGPHIAAPAGADPYLTCSCIAQNIFDELGLLRREPLRNAVLQQLYRLSYALTASAPRPDAKAVLDDLLDRDLRVVVVTNSRTDAVAHKVDELGLGHRDRLAVFGDAKKFVIDAEPRDPRFDALEDMTVPGLASRKVAIKRGHYYDLLKALWEEEGVGPEETLVCGDIFELDLALPLAMGARVGLMVNRFTPPWETAYLADHPRGALLERIDEIPAFVGW